MTENSEQIIGLLIKDPDASGSQIFPVRKTSSLTIGRAPDNDIFLTDLRVKRHHCRLLVEGEQVYVVVGVPLHSHTWVNETEVRDSCRLTSGDVIVVGGTVFRFDQPASPCGEGSAAKSGEAQQLD